jgi:hypothetical protein
MAMSNLSQGIKDERPQKTGKEMEKKERNDILFILQRCLELTLEYFPFVLTQEVIREKLQFLQL